MYEVSLVNLPFASITMPSLALMQLQAAIERARLDTSVAIVHANHDCAHDLGVALYGPIADHVDSNMAGLGDWYFRQCAFADLNDNAPQYFRRFFRDPYSTSGGICPALVACPLIRWSLPRC